MYNYYRIYKYIIKSFIDYSELYLLDTIQNIWQQKSTSLVIMTPNNQIPKPPKYQPPQISVFIRKRIVTKITIKIN